MFKLAGFSEQEIDELMQSHQLPDSGRDCLIFSPDFFETIAHMPRFSTADDLEPIKNL